MNHESLSIPEDGEVWCELEERQYQKFKARLIKEGLLAKPLIFSSPSIDWDCRVTCGQPGAAGC